eukprot:g12033.t1
MGELITAVQEQLAEVGKMIFFTNVPKLAMCLPQHEDYIFHSNLTGCSYSAQQCAACHNFLEGKLKGLEPCAVAETSQSRARCELLMNEMQEDTAEKADGERIVDTISKSWRSRSDDLTMPLAWQLGCQDRPEFRTPSDADSLGLGQLGPRWHGVNRCDTALLQDLGCCPLDPEAAKVMSDEAKRSLALEKFQDERKSERVGELTGVADAILNDPDARFKLESVLKMKVRHKKDEVQVLNEETCDLLNDISQIKVPKSNKDCRWNFKKARCEPKPGCEPCQTSGRARRASGRVRAIAVVSRAIAAMFEPRELRERPQLLSSAAEGSSLVVLHHGLFASWSASEDYKYRFGDRSLHKSCRLSAQKQPTSDAECLWNYKKARCHQPLYCARRCKPGKDWTLDQCCKLRTKEVTAAKVFTKLLLDEGVLPKLIPKLGASVAPRPKEVLADLVAEEGATEGSESIGLESDESDESSVGLESDESDESSAPPAGEGASAGEGEVEGNCQSPSDRTLMKRPNLSQDLEDASRASLGAAFGFPPVYLKRDKVLKKFVELGMSEIFYSLIQVASLLNSQNRLRCANAALKRDDLARKEASSGRGAALARAEQELLQQDRSLDITVDGFLAFEAFDLPRWPSASMNASDIPCRVLLSQWQVKQVLGDKGEENLKRLRMTSGANVQLLRGLVTVLWADDGVRLRRALNGLLERAYAKRQVGNLRKEDEPDSHVLEVMIPEVACRHLIGARGDRIKLLREESRCEARLHQTIHMSPGNVAGIAAQRRVKCNGLVPSLAEAVARIHEVLVEFAEIGILSLRHFDLQEVSTGVQETNEGHVTSRFLGPGLAGISRREARNARIAVRQLVSAEECGWLIGKRGNKIHKLREPGQRVCNGGPRSVVEIFGAPIAKCICVLQLIVDDLELFPEVQPCTSLLVPASLAPFLTGLDEAASKGCDARVLAGGNWFLLELRGTAQQRLLGAQAAHEAVEAAAAEPTFSDSDFRTWLGAQAHFFDQACAYGLHFLEVYAGAGRATLAVRAAGGIALCLGLDHGQDFRLARDRALALALIDRLKPHHVWLSFPCTSFCAWIRLAVLRGCDLEPRLREGRLHLRFACQLADKQFTKENSYSREAFATGAQLGSLVLKAAGGWEEANRAVRRTWIQREGDHFEALHGDFFEGLVDPTLLERARQNAIWGVEANYDGGEGARVRATPHPSLKEHLDEAAKQIWHDAQRGRVLLCVDVGQEELQHVVSVALARVPKMLPDRTVSDKGRVVWDATPINQYCHKSRHPPALQPKHDEVTRLIAWWKARLPGIEILLAKKDVSEAFKWLPVKLPDTRLFAADLPGKEFHLESNVTVLYNSLTFGWRGAPGEYMLYAWVSKVAHAAFAPEVPDWHDTVSFRPLVLMDDTVLIEPDIGVRPHLSVRTAEACVQATLGKKALNQEKDEVEGSLEHRKLIWGLIYDTQACTRALPPVKLEKAAFLLHLPEFDFGSKRVPLKLVQELRGNQQFWLAVMPSLSPLLGATNDLLGPPDEQGFARPRGSGAEQERVWRRFWEAIEVQRLLVDNRAEWATRFTHPMTEALSIRELLALPGGKDSVVWASGDATLERVGAVDWSAKEAYSLDVGFYAEALQEFARKAADEFRDARRVSRPGLEGEQSGDEGDKGHLMVALTELLAVLLLAAHQHLKWKGKVVLYFGDNQVVMAWLKKRQARHPLAGFMIQMLSAIEASSGFQLHSSYIRTYHNKVADALTREDAEEVMKGQGLAPMQNIKECLHRFLERSWQKRALVWAGQTDADRAQALRLSEQREGGSILRFRGWPGLVHRMGMVRCSRSLDLVRLMQLLAFYSKEPSGWNAHLDLARKQIRRALEAGPKRIRPTTREELRWRLEDLRKELAEARKEEQKEWKQRISKLEQENSAHQVEIASLESALQRLDRLDGPEAKEKLEELQRLRHRTDQAKRRTSVAHQEDILAAKKELEARGKDVDEVRARRKSISAEQKGVVLDGKRRISVLQELQSLLDEARKERQLAKENLETALAELHLTLGSHSSRDDASYVESQISEESLDLFRSSASCLTPATSGMDVTFSRNT